MGCEINPAFHTKIRTFYLQLASVWNQRRRNTFFQAKFSPTFDPFGSALIWALQGLISISDSLCSPVVFDDTFGLTLLCGLFFAGWLLPHWPLESASALCDGGPGAAVGSSVPFITPIILLALIVAAVGGRGHFCTGLAVAGLEARHFCLLSFVQRRRFRCCPDRVRDTLTGWRVVGTGRSTSFQFKFMRSLQHRSSCSARRRGQGAPRGSCVDHCSAAPFDTECLFRRPASSSGFVSSAGYLFSLSRNATSLDQDDTDGLDAFDCYRRMYPPCPSIPTPGSSAAPAQAAEPACCACPSRPHRHPSVPKGSSPPRLP